jgi:hypothetical protein
VITLATISGQLTDVYTILGRIVMILERGRPNPWETQPRPF